MEVYLLYQGFDLCTLAISSVRSASNLVISSFFCWRLVSRSFIVESLWNKAFKFLNNENTLKGPWRVFFFLQSTTQHNSFSNVSIIHRENNKDLYILLRPQSSHDSLVTTSHVSVNSNICCLIFPPCPTFPPPPPTTNQKKRTNETKSHLFWVCLCSSCKWFCRFRTCWLESSFNET